MLGKKAPLLESSQILNQCEEQELTPTWPWMQRNQKTGDEEQN